MEHDRQRLDRQRLDKVLWFIRMVKSRALAVELIEAGHVRVNGQKVKAPGKPVAIGDVLTVALERDVKVVRILAFAERRGPYSEACLLYEAPDDPSMHEPDAVPALPCAR